MAFERADVVICGAGIAGISTSYHLAVKYGMPNIILVDERPPLSLTSDKSTECYRNWWPGPGEAMVRLMNHSIDIMEEIASESGNVFNMNRRGYLFATADEGKIESFMAAGKEAESLGAGPLQVHSGRPGDPPYKPIEGEGWEGQPTGSDLILDQLLIKKYFPYLNHNTRAVIHARRCGWFSAQQLGMYLLEKAKDYGVKFINAKVTGTQIQDGKSFLENNPTILIVRLFYIYQVVT